MNPIAFDIANQLEEEELGTVASTEAWGIFVETMPDEPTKCIAVSDGPSPPPGITAGMDEEPFERCMFQIRVRGRSYKETYDKIQAASKALTGQGKGRWLVEEDEVPVVEYKGIFRQSDFLPLVSGEKGVYIRSVNLLALRQELAAEVE